MKAKLLGLMALGSLLGMSQADASTLVGTRTDAMGIDGLVVPSVGTFDVIFLHESYNTVIDAYGAPYFIDNMTGAEAADKALATALYGLGVTKLTGLPTGKYEEMALIPFRTYEDGEYVESFKAYCSPEADLFCPYPDGWTSAKPNTKGTPTDYARYYADFTVFTAVVTPVPAAFPLFATGLGALGWLAWRRKRNNAAAMAAV